jgi:hypothetical protein
MMKPEELLVILRHPIVKKEIENQLEAILDKKAKKENANSKQAAKREKRG